MTCCKVGGGGTISFALRFPWYALKGNIGWSSGGVLRGSGIEKKVRNGQNHNAKSNDNNRHREKARQKVGECLREIVGEANSPSLWEGMHCRNGGGVALSCGACCCGSSGRGRRGVVGGW